MTIDKPTIEQVEALVKERYKYADTIRHVHITTVYYAVLDLIEKKEGVESEHN